MDAMAILQLGLGLTKADIIMTKNTMNDTTDKNKKNIQFSLESWSKIIYYS